MNEREADTYEQLFERIRSEIEQAEKEIFETKIELEQARKIRRNRMEYDAMAKVSYIYSLVLYSTRINNAISHYRINLDNNIVVAN